MLQLVAATFLIRLFSFFTYKSEHNLLFLCFHYALRKKNTNLYPTIIFPFTLIQQTKYKDHKHRNSLELSSSYIHFFINRTKYKLLIVFKDHKRPLTTKSFKEFLYLKSSLSFYTKFLLVYCKPPPFLIFEFFNGLPIPMEFVVSPAVVTVAAVLCPVFFHLLTDRFTASCCFMFLPGGTFPQSGHLK